MEENCKNCNEIITGKFCITCGQKKYKRIDKKYILDEIQYTFLHTNKGLLHSIKHILKNPGNTAREFIAGNRVNHYKPILLTFLLGGIAGFALSITHYAIANNSLKFIHAILPLISIYLVCWDSGKLKNIQSEIQKKSSR